MLSGMFPLQKWHVSVAKRTYSHSSKLESNLANNNGGVRQKQKRVLGISSQ